MKRCIIWMDDTDRIILNQRVPDAIGGANVQMAFWLRTLAANGWHVNAFTYNFANRKVIKGVSFFYLPLIRNFMFLLYNIKFIYLILNKPDLVITRGCPGGLKILLSLKKILKFKILHTLASDKDIIPEKHNFSNFEQYLKEVDFLVAQNNFQQEAANNKLGREVPIIPNIWDSEMFKSYQVELPQKSDAIWIANFRNLKRPEWFLEIASLNPGKQFIMVGTSQDDKCYNKSKQLADGLTNVQFLGYQSLYDVDKLIAHTKIVVCTSEYEGFPNTFIHAWSHSKPVVSSVDPSNLIVNNNLGIFADTVVSMNLKIKELLANKEMYHSKVLAIDNYFKANHLPGESYKKLMNYIKSTLS